MHHQAVAGCLRASLAAALLCLGSVPAQAQGRALVMSETLRPELVATADTITQMLLAHGIATDVTLPLPGMDPGDLAAYTCVFDLRVDYPLDPVIAGRVGDHVRRGRGAYLAGEHAVFAPRNDSLTNLIASLGGGSPLVSTVVGGFTMPRDIIEPTNPAHPLSTDCSAVDEVDYDGINNGQFIALGNGTWITGNPLSAGMAAWDPGTLAAAPGGRVVVALDINWLATGAAGTLDFQVTNPTVPTQNRAMAENMVQYLCVPDVACSGCEPRNHGYWHRACLGWGLIDPGRNGRGRGPTQVQDGLDPLIAAAADAALAAHGTLACPALDEGPMSDPRVAALRELATLQLNLKGKKLSTACPIELAPVLDATGLTVRDAVAEIQRLLALGDRDSLRDAAWIGAHVNNGEALLRR